MITSLNKGHIVPLLSVSLPAIISYTLETVQDLIMFHFLGLLVDPIYIASVGLGNMWANITTLSVLIGFSSALQTLCSQSFGKQDYYMTGTYHLRARFVVFIIGFPLSFMTFFSEYILIGLGIEKELAHQSYVYACWLIPGNFIISQYEITKRYLLTLKLVKPVVMGVALMLAFSPMINYYFILKFSNPIIGCAVAKGILYLINLIFLLCYIQATKCCGKTWFWFNRDSFRELGVYIKFGLFGAMMLCFEWWGFELISVMAGNLGPVQLAASVCVFAITNSIYRSAMGVMSGVCCMVGNEIGAGKVNEAKSYAKLGLMLTLLLVFCLGLIIISIKRVYCNFFTKNAEVVEILNTLLVFIVAIELLDTLNGSMQNIIIGLGKQNIATIVNLVAYYAIMIPTAYVLAFKLGWKIYGLWAAIGIAITLQTITYISYLLVLDWEKVMNENRIMLEEERKRMIDNKIDETNKATQLL